MGANVFTKEQEEELRELYLEEGLHVKEVAERIGRPYRSVISKLVHMKIYENDLEKGSKRKGRFAKELIYRLEEILDIQFGHINELSGQPNMTHSENLALLVDALKEKLKDV